LLLTQCSHCSEETPQTTFRPPPFTNVDKEAQKGDPTCIRLHRGRIRIELFHSKTQVLDNTPFELGVVIHICNPSYSEGEGKRIKSSRTTQQR
jgi:hypothetical protein